MNRNLIFKIRKILLIKGNIIKGKETFYKLYKMSRERIKMEINITFVQYNIKIK
jgi:hypothetical protein